MITDGVLLGIITALAITGSIHVIETLFRLLTRIIGSGKNASRLSVGVEAGLNFQLGTSVWLSWLALTRNARSQYVHGDKKKRHFSGIVAVTLISGVLLTTVLLLEVAVVYMSQPVTVYSTLGKGAIKTFIVQAGGDVTTADFNEERILEMSESGFSETKNVRHVSTAYVHPVDLAYNVAQELETVSSEEGQTISAWTEYVVDGKNEDGTIAEENAKYRKKSNQFSLHVIRRDNRLLTVMPFRAIETLNTSITLMFTDFGEDEASVMETELFSSLGLGCAEVGRDMEKGLRITEYSCKLEKNLTAEDFSAVRACDQARQNMARRIFKVGDYSVEREMQIRDGQAIPGEQIQGIFAIEKGVNSSGSGFTLLCVVAALGVVRLFCGIFVDFRGIAENNLFISACTEHSLAGPGNQDSIEGYGWRVYQVGDENYFGFTKCGWSEDHDTPCSDVGPIKALEIA